MLRDEYRMVPPRRLPAVIRWIRHRDSPLEDVGGVAHHFFHSPPLDERPLAIEKTEFRSKLVAREALEELGMREEFRMAIHCFFVQANPEWSIWTISARRGMVLHRMSL